MAAVTPTLAPIVNIPIAKITWRPVKPEERKFDPEAAQKLADSILTDGLLNPIIVMDNPEKPGHYIGVTGRHRAYGCEKTLKWKEIPARVITPASDDDVKSMTIAENLWRNPLEKHQRSKAIAEWHRIFEARVAVLKAERAAKKAATKKAAPEVTGDAAPAVPAEDADGGSNLDPGAEGSVAEAATDAPPEAEAADAPIPGEFAVEAAKATGMSETGVKRSLKIGNAFSNEQVRILDENKITQEIAETMANLPQDQRDDAVSLIASGMDPVEAIGEATKQDSIKTAGNRVLDATKGSAEARKNSRKAAKAAKAEEQESDDDWLARECGDRMALMPEATRATFRKHALLYRRTRELRRRFAQQVEPIMAQARKDGVKYGMSGVINRMLGVEHPKAWNRCGDCGANGCAKCNTLGFLVGNVARSSG